MLSRLPFEILERCESYLGGREILIELMKLQSWSNVVVTFSMWSRIQLCGPIYQIKPKLNLFAMEGLKNWCLRVADGAVWNRVCKLFYCIYGPLKNGFHKLTSAVCYGDMNVFAIDDWILNACRIVL